MPKTVMRKFSYSELKIEKVFLPRMQQNIFAGAFLTLEVA